MNSNKKNPYILIIDDDSVITTILQTLLSDKYEIITFNDSTQDYIEILNSYDIALLLLDINMPEKNGFEVAKDIKNYEKFSDIPIIYITVNIDEDTIIKAFENHASDYIKKPFNKEELKARVNAHITNYKNLIEIKKQQNVIYTQAKNTAMRDTLVKISHHWRQPLSAISLTAQSLEIENQFGNASSQTITEATNEIIDATKKLSDSINFFSELSYNDRYSESQDIAYEFSQVIESLKTIYKEDHINIIYSNNFHDDVIKLEINVVNLKNVLMNLVSNSIEAYEKNNSETHRDIYINIELNANHLKIYLKDLVGGIKEEYIDKVFEPYFTTKDDLNGTGIGLYICKNIVESQYKGSIEGKNITEKDKKGFEVIIDIPIGKILN